MISSEDAFLLIKKWKTERCSLRILLTLGFGGGYFSCTVADVDESSVQLVGADSSCEFILSLAGASFEYGDTREAPPPIRDSSPFKYSGCLSVFFPGGGPCGFFRAKDITELHRTHFDPNLGVPFPKFRTDWLRFLNLLLECDLKGDSSFSMTYRLERLDHMG